MEMASITVSINDTPDNNGSSQTPRHQPTTEKKLTIQGQSKIEEELEKKLFHKHGPSRVVYCIKWVATIILTILLLAFVTLSKVTMISISKHMHIYAGKQDGQSSEEVACRMFVMLFLIVLLPQCVNFLRCFCGRLFSRDISWPTFWAFFWGFFISAIETFGICVFVMKIPGMTQPYNVILLMNCVYLLPIIVACVKAVRSWRKDTEINVTCIFCVIACFSVLAGTGLTGYLCRQYNSADLKDIWYPIVGVLCLSVAWLPEIQTYLLRIKTTETVENKPAQKKLTRKMLIYMSFWKTFFTFVISFVFLGRSIFPSHSVASDVFSQFRIGWSSWQGKEIYYFIANNCSSILGYTVGFIACTTCMHRTSFVLPLSLATPLAAVLFAVKSSCSTILFVDPALQECGLDEKKKLDVALFCVAVGCFVLAYAFSFGYRIWTNKLLLKQDETQIFWWPTYNGVLLEQWLSLSQKNKLNDERHDASEKTSRVYICTTMYREADYEMKQLLESINQINQARNKDKIYFECHIFFDDALRDGKLTNFVLNLVALVQSTLDRKPKDCTKVTTPYGMSLSCMLKGLQDGCEKEGSEMLFRIHLKDILKVRNKKRWSQIMYMSFVLDHLQEENVTDEETYILTTDADVQFTPDAVEALLDLMTRDSSVGAVCARTHPLGSGPIVWYQVFEYALGHWFQKAAEHVIGSVLCSPGCFSVYRCKAIKDVLPTYASNVKDAFDFLTKDMGEDRWLCTLLVQTGWRIEYCAASKNKTYCPQDFEEFFKQRRRWVASTLANMMLLLKQEWYILMKFNQRVSVFFLLYQGVLLFATLIGPSTIILVVCGGLSYGWNIDTTTSLVLQLLICVGYTLICLFTSQKIQLMVAKLLTFVYSMIMTVVVVGTAVEIVTDFSPDEISQPTQANTTKKTTVSSKVISEDIHLSMATVFLTFMASIYVVAGILHLKECIYLVHSVWYLLCLPSGYLILLIYSICNITDRSWGTRDAQRKSVTTKPRSWQETLHKVYKTLCFCCFQRESTTYSTGPSSTPAENTQFSRHKSRQTTETCGGVNLDSPGSSWTDQADEHESTLAQDKDARNIKERRQIQHATDSRKKTSTTKGGNEVAGDLGTVVTVEERLPKELENSARLENPTEEELKIKEIRKALDEVAATNLDPKECKFWDRLRKIRLLPIPTKFGQEEDLKRKLGDLRNQWLMVFAVANALWLILITTLAHHGQLLSLFGSNFVGFVVMILFTFVIMIQFLAMIVHRVGTLTHFLGRAPYRKQGAYRKSWIL